MAGEGFFGFEHPRAANAALKGQQSGRADCNHLVTD